MGFFPSPGPWLEHQDTDLGLNSLFLSVIAGEVPSSGSSQAAGILAWEVDSHFCLGNLVFLFSLELLFPPARHDLRSSLGTFCTWSCTPIPPAAPTRPPKSACFDFLVKFPQGIAPNRGSLHPQLCPRSVLGRGEEQRRCWEGSIPAPLPWGDQESGNSAGNGLSPCPVPLIVESWNGLGLERPQSHPQGHPRVTSHHPRLLLGAATAPLEIPFPHRVKP